jgi:hypothetical protein
MVLLAGMGRPLLSPTGKDTVADFGCGLLQGILGTSDCFHPA